MTQLTPISKMPLEAKDWYILLVASMEQIIGAALSTIVGIMIPLMLMLTEPHPDALQQGLLGASGLLGIAIGSLVIGQLMDSLGYLLWFRLGPVLITCASVGVYFSKSIFFLCLFLCLIGVGVGGGYSLDSGYLSEIIPNKWKSFFVGVAKALSSAGFIGGAVVGYFMLKLDPHPAIWPNLIIFIGILGVISFIMRIRWYQSPLWLLSKGKNAEAQEAARDFFGPEAEVLPPDSTCKGEATPLAAMFSGENLKKVILSGCTWACEGFGVYGFAVFLPILVMALGLQGDSATGIPKVIDSVETTIFINLFIAAGFALGLAILHRINIISLMGWGFVICGIALAGLLAAHQWAWPVWISFLCFVIFETALNAGPHLVTYIVPSRIYSVNDRGAGTGIATLLGKIGAILGVFFMPWLLKEGGIVAVLGVSSAIQFLGAVISFVYGKKLNLL